MYFSLVLFVCFSSLSSSFQLPHINNHNIARNNFLQSTKTDSDTPTQSTKINNEAAAATANDDDDVVFKNFCDFLLKKQESLINELESMDKLRESDFQFPIDTFFSSSNNEKDTDGKFTRDEWGNPYETSGGITRVIQKGNIIEKGACSITILRDGILSKERASSIQGRQEEQDGVMVPQEGDKYSAAALSIVLHTKSPLIPTFRSDVRIFLVKSSNSDDDSATSSSLAWFGGGADLTPYYIVDKADISQFHQEYLSLCKEHFGEEKGKQTYKEFKKNCDSYFYLPARAEHRGTGGIFFDDFISNNNVMEFVKGVTNTWTPSWFPIIEKYRAESYTKQQKEWQLLRRGRYLEFNLLYDRGVKFGLNTGSKNPRVEGVMVSAPPLIAWEYNHEITEGSSEDELMKILKDPIEWV